MKSALSFAILSLLMCLPAQAHEVETGSVMICDTQKQVERFVQIFDGNHERAIRAINAEENNPSACAMVDVAYVQGPSIGMARTMSHAFRIIPVAVIAVNTPGGFRPIQSALFFTLVKVKEYAV
jgi:hypothetical protein